MKRHKNWEYEVLYPITEKGIKEDIWAVGSRATVHDVIEDYGKKVNGYICKERR
jgi:hypothetical protein